MMMPGLATFVSISILLGLSIAGPALAQNPSSAATPALVSPDKQWRYAGGEKPKLVKASTDEEAVEFMCELAGRDASPLMWAPDSMRFAVACSGGKGKSTSVYQLRKGRWEAGDE